MKRSEKLWILLGVLAAVCIALVAVIRIEEQQENIRNSDEVILSIPSDSVTSLSWEYEDTALSFHWEDGWVYDSDAAFPVDEEKINAFLSRFEAFSVSFVIEDVEDFSQYGLDDPTCTVTLGAGEETYEILLGSYSTMDEERYVSIGDGKVYLVPDDPLEDYDAPPSAR